MEQVQVFLALLCKLSCDVSMLVDVVLHGTSDHGLSRELDGCKLANTAMDLNDSWIVLIQELLSETLWALRWSWWVVRHLLHLHVLNELSPR